MSPIWHWRIGWLRISFKIPIRKIVTSRMLRHRNLPPMRVMKRSGDLKIPRLAQQLLPHYLIPRRFFPSMNLPWTQRRGQTEASKPPFLKPQVLVPAFRLQQPVSCMRNHIRLQDVTFLAATLANAASIGVSRDDYLQDKPSPFLIAAQREPQSHTSRNFEHIKPHLRPLDIQLSRPHASYLDLIIFPHFRERAMLHATSDPCLLDQEALFTDMISGGLTCWGSLACGNERGCGVPWDMRSWEAKPWFLKKWWFLVGRKDEDMWETSIWWWQLRGGEPEYELTS